MSNDAFSRRSTLIALVLLSVAVVLIAVDLYVDFSEGVGVFHLVAEVFLFGIAITGMVALYRNYDRARSDLAGALVEAEHWKNESRELLKGLGEAIEHQFNRWSLTAAEAEVALFLLKGLSHREIAELRRTSERTVREQSRSVYRKSGLTGRSALSAFFLEDLLLPQSQDRQPHGGQAVPP